MNQLVGIIIGSDSDLPVMKDAAVVLEEFGIVAARVFGRTSRRGDDEQKLPEAEGEQGP